MDDRQRDDVVDDILRNVSTSKTFTFESTYARMQERAPEIDAALAKVEAKKHLEEDLITLVKRLTWTLDQKSPYHPLVDHAKEFLAKHDLGAVARSK